MSELVQLRERVKGLEDRVDDVESLARSTDREVADWRTTLNNHTKLLKAIRDDHVDQGKKLARFEANVEDKFEVLRKGQEQITELLTRHLGEPDEETPAGGAGE